MEKKLISIVCCCYNEAGNIPETYRQLKDIMSKLEKYDYEIIFEDNASEDGTQDILRDIASKDKHVKVIINGANFGASRSAANVYCNAAGDAVIAVVADLQDPLEMIPEFIRYWEEGYDVVWGQKTSSKENFIKRGCRNLFYGIIGFFSEKKEIPNVTGFGLQSKTVVQIANILQKQDPEMHMRHIITGFNFKIKLIPYTQKERVWGKSSYNMKRYFIFAITSLCNTSTVPLHLMTASGFIIGLLSIIAALGYFIYKLVNWYTFQVGVAPVVIGVFFFGGVILWAVGMLGEYLSIVLRRITKSPLVIEKERINFQNYEEKN